VSRDGEAAIPACTRRPYEVTPARKIKRKNEHMVADSCLQEQDA